MVSQHLLSRRSVAVGLAATVVALAAGAQLAPSAQASTPAGLVFQNTNPSGPNAVQVYSVAPDGALTAGPLVATGGAGTGASLGNQGGVVRAGRRVLVVNAGDSTVSVLDVVGGGLRLRDVAPSGGSTPVSVTVHDDRVFVLNAGSDSITGFRLDGANLEAVPGTTRRLSGTGVGAAEVRFSPDGRSLVVSEKATNTLMTFRVGEDGRPDAGTATASVGAVPFGFDIDGRNHVVVSEAAPSALSSYRLGRNGLAVVTAGVPDSQRAACWVEISRSGRVAWTTNAASATVSAYAVAPDGSLTLVAPVAATTQPAPTDIAESGDGRFLFVRVGSGAVQSFRVGAGGSLTPAGSAQGAAAFGTSGLAAS